MLTELIQFMQVLLLNKQEAGLKPDDAFHTIGEQNHRSMNKRCLKSSEDSKLYCSMEKFACAFRRSFSTQSSAQILACGPAVPPQGTDRNSVHFQHCLNYCYSSSKHFLYKGHFKHWKLSSLCRAVLDFGDLHVYRKIQKGGNLQVTVMSYIICCVIPS